jgi:hypothetical protein
MRVKLGLSFYENIKRIFNKGWGQYRHLGWTKNKPHSLFRVTFPLKATAPGSPEALVPTHLVRWRHKSDDDYEFYRRKNLNATHTTGCPATSVTNYQLKSLTSPKNECFNNYILH